ncbi:unnamed protein product, partial [Mesorhabditis spiculigera]
MDPSVDPCEDFHEFACGRWNQRQSAQLLQTRTFELKQQILDALYHQDKSESSAMETARKFVDVCQNLDTRQLDKDIQNYAKRLGTVPIIGQTLENGREMPSILDSLELTARYVYERYTYRGNIRTNHQPLALIMTLEPKFTFWGRWNDWPRFDDSRPPYNNCRHFPLSKIYQEADRYVLQDFLFINWIRGLKNAMDTRFKLLCRDRFVAHFYKIADYLLIKYLRNNKNLLPEVKAMAENVRRFFHQILDVNTWLHEKTKAKLKQQLDNVEALIGYGSNALNLTFIDELYEMVTVPQNPTSVELFQFEEQITWNSMDLDVGDSFDIGRYTVAQLNAWNWLGTAIKIPIGYLEPPFFDPDWPLEFNYGLMGATIGHEFTHSFDEQVELPAENVGNDTNEFLEKRQCLVDQFGAVLYPNERLNISLKGDGLAQVKETLADNNGHRVAWLAYHDERQKRYGRNPPKLPGLLEYTNDQIFFLANAQKQCGRLPVVSPDSKWMQFVHPVTRVRINERVKNYEFFATTFKCKLNSTMNPEKKCKVWRRLRRH